MRAIQFLLRGSQPVRVMVGHSSASPASARIPIRSRKSRRKVLRDVTISVTVRLQIFPFQFSIFSSGVGTAAREGGGE